MKVLHLLESPHFSGAENVVCQIISMLNRENIEFIYCSRDGQIREALQERQIKFCPIKKLSVSEIKRVIQEEKPDLIHAHDMRASFFAALSSGNIPIISHIHNNNFDSRGLSVKSILYFFAAARTRHIFWVSQSSFEGYRFHDRFRKKSTVLYNIIDINALEEKMNLDRNEYEYEVVFLGRLTAPKNPQRLVRVFSDIQKRRPLTKMAIIGTGDLEQEIVEMIEKLDLTKNVSYLGFQSNPYKILHDSKVMIMTSRWEGTPMCALEAMSLGVPIVSTPTDGLKDLVQDDVTGYLSDSDEELAEKICNILDNIQLWKRLSLNSRQKAKVIMDKSKYQKQILNAYGFCEISND